MKDYNLYLSCEELSPKSIDFDLDPERSVVDNLVDIFDKEPLTSIVWKINDYPRETKAAEKVLGTWLKIMVTWGDSLTELVNKADDFPDRSPTFLSDLREYVIKNCEWMES